MIHSNEIGDVNNSIQIENKNCIKFEYIISFPEFLANKIDELVERFHSSNNIVLNRLLINHFDILLSEIEREDYELLSFYYFNIDEIFADNEVKDSESCSDSGIKIKKISIKVNPEINTVIKTICEEIHYKPALFIQKAIQCQWNMIGADIEAGHYYIIDDFCNIPRIKQALKNSLKSFK